MKPSSALRFFAALLGAAAVARATETEWPQFRGPTGQGLSNATNVPVEWSANSSNVAWKIDVPGRGWSSPVLSHGKLYLTSAVPGSDGGALTLHALCYDAANGQVLWDTEVFRPDPESVAKMHQKNSPASPTPIVTDDRV
ncbi:MAG TPA: PQQ-binding-like beta-propeller repeat protein, partial [Chthoniobacteraceae bacterium]